MKRAAQLFFSEWLKLQKGRTDAIGELSRAFGERFVPRRKTDCYRSTLQMSKQAGISRELFEEAWAAFRDGK